MLPPLILSVLIIDWCPLLSVLDATLGRRPITLLKRLIGHFGYLEIVGFGYEPIFFRMTLEDGLSDISDSNMILFSW